ncbi:MAG: anaerobic ribonucleoside-triphosphate reductase activating protein [Rickettsiales bacterium]|jgi:anaerobic ribonucleoside-triphosphate reductase activating protein|nr:anaerobic ribonucleoside-triphosphate reductase activating protein [Rickettsiales bacterium]
MSVQIGGLTSFTTIDYPGKLAAVVFLAGCPLGCAYCSNPHLVVRKDGEYSPEKVLEFLRGRAGKLAAVVFSGGESLMQGDVALEYMRGVKELGFLIGLHTNGFYPEALRRALGIADWVGLDVKAGDSENYHRLTGSENARGHAFESLDILIASGKSFECRTTADPRFVSKDSLLGIAADLAARGVKNFAVQKYTPHYEADFAKTTLADRMQFFTDAEFRGKINAMFENVIWRE